MQAFATKLIRRSTQEISLTTPPLLSAGVTGLTSALFLAEAGHTVTVIAAHVPGDSSIEYTSPWYVFELTTCT